MSDYEKLSVEKAAHGGFVVHGTDYDGDLALRIGASRPRNQPPI
jgi:hypothetical protein